MAMRMRDAIRIMGDRVQVTKAFARKAQIYGTEEYRIWLEIQKDVPGAKMETKKIKRNPEKKTSNKNLTYVNMERYIRTQEGAEEVLKEFEVEKLRSKITHHPYSYMRAWFVAKYPDYAGAGMFAEANEATEDSSSAA